MGSDVKLATLGEVWKQPPCSLLRLLSFLIPFNALIIEIFHCMKTFAAKMYNIWTGTGLHLPWSSRSNESGCRSVFPNRVYVKQDKLC